MDFSIEDNDEAPSEMNITPLVDVLLVVFIVTAPLLTNSIPINLPKTEAVAPAENKEPLVVSIDAGGRWLSTGTPLPPSCCKATSRRPAR